MYIYIYTVCIYTRTCVRTCLSTDTCKDPIIASTISGGFGISNPFTIRGLGVGMLPF